MSAAKSVFDTSQLLHDGDCNIMDEYNTVVVGALDMRRKFASIVSQARRLKTELQAKQAEIDHLTTSESPYICWNTRVVACPASRLCAWMPFLWASFTETLVCSKSKIFAGEFRRSRSIFAGRRGISKAPCSIDQCGRAHTAIFFALYQ
jgi:hypothetical protein